MKSLSKILSSFEKPVNNLREFVKQSNAGIAANLAREIDLEKQLEANKASREEITKEKKRAETVISRFEKLLAVDEEPEIGDEEVPF